ncbi:MAG: hypothetical protein IPK63_17960 [Candidatus Competibacteraceae bacterium]|nr:hypothetical protein [Candidatus Competibacteraceae bacterium]
MRRLTHADAWFVQTDASMGLQYFQRIALSKGRTEDFRTGNWEQKPRAVVHWLPPTGALLFGSEGA